MEQCICDTKTNLVCSNCSYPTCSACLTKCKTCGKRFCEPCFEEHKKVCGRPEFRPAPQWPDYIEMDCGCSLIKEKAGKVNKSPSFPDGFAYTYIIETFCEEHDPSLWENFEDE